MKITQFNKCLDVYYDDRCSVCSSFINWLSLQPYACNVNFVSYQSARAEEWFRGLSDGEPERSLAVRNDSGGMYRGDAAWVQCMLGCLNYGEIGERLTSPMLSAVAKKVCHLAADDEFALKDLFSNSTDDEIVSQLAELPLSRCEVDDRDEIMTIMAGIPDGII